MVCIPCPGVLSRNMSETFDATKSVTDVLAERVRRYRERAKLRQEDLADRTAELGHPLSRVTLAKLEAGGTRATNASLVDVLVLAAALDVPPPLLVLPLGEAEEVAITPELVAHPHVVLDWWSGHQNLGVGSRRTWHANAAQLRMLRGLRVRQDAVRAAWVQAEKPGAGPAEQRQLDVAMSALASWIEAMRASGLQVPEMPPEWQARMAGLEEYGRQP